MKIVGICGEIGSGKSTFAEMLTQIDPEHSLHLETSQVIIELGDVFNAALSLEDRKTLQAGNYLDISREPIKAMLPAISRMAGRTIANEELSLDPADAKQNPQWYEKLEVYITAIQGNPQMLETPITRQNKDTYRPLLQWIGGYVLYKLDNNLLWYQELLRRTNTAGSDSNLAALTAPKQPAEAEYVRENGGIIIKLIRLEHNADRTDVTERLASAIIPDIEILNNGTLDEFSFAAKRVYDDLFAGSLQPVYRARA